MANGKNWKFLMPSMEKYSSSQKKQKVVHGHVLRRTNPCGKPLGNKKIKRVLWYSKDGRQKSFQENYFGKERKIYVLWREQGIGDHIIFLSLGT